MKRLVLGVIISSLVAIGAVAYAQGPGMMGHDMMGEGMMESEQKKGVQTQNTSAGADIFNANCRVCHVNGGNIINPAMPLKGSAKLANFEIFLSFIRNPKLSDGSRGAMLSFSNSQISDKQAAELYAFITSSESNLMSGGQKGWSCPQSAQCKGFQKRYPMGPGMMSSQGMGPSMMGSGQQGWNYCPYCGQSFRKGGYGMMGGGYGMGPGMMRDDMGHGMMESGYSGQSADCQKFFDETSDLRKDFHSKKFEYMETFRNPNETPESLRELHNELKEIYSEIQSKAPQGCWVR